MQKEIKARINEIHKRIQNRMFERENQRKVLLKALEENQRKLQEVKKMQSERMSEQIKSMFEHKAILIDKDKGVAYNVGSNDRKKIQELYPGFELTERKPENISIEILDDGYSIIDISEATFSLEKKSYADEFDDWVHRKGKFRPKKYSGPLDKIQ